MKILLCLAYAITPLLMTFDYSAADELNIVELLEGRWKYRVIDSDGNDIHEPNLVEYNKTSSGNSLISESGKSFTILNYDSEAKLYLMMECAFVMGSPRTSYLVGRYDKENKLIEWRENNIRGMRKLIWKIRNTENIIIEMDQIWVRKQNEISNATPIPQDAPSEIELVYSMERLTK